MRQFTEVSQFIDELKKINPEKVAKDPLICTKVNKIKIQASSPLCAEQVIRLLVEILSLKYDYKMGSLSVIKLGDDSYIKTFASVILPLLGRENNKELLTHFQQLVTQFIPTSSKKDTEVLQSSLIRSLTEKQFYQQLKTLCEKHISCVDVNFVMRAASLATRVRTTADKQAILVLGVTGAGKSLAINFIGCPEMFSLGFFSRKLEVDLKKQPKYLEHIKIGQSVVSETFEMGVVEVDRFAQSSKEMPTVCNQGYVICDTPGAGDNRNLGPELKLANTLQTIAPIYKAKTVRFLILISANAVSARGAEFQKTIRFAAKMFVNQKALDNAADSMLFAISGDAGWNNLTTFKQQIKEFGEQRHTLGFDDKEASLIKILATKFGKDEVLLIRPCRDHTASPAQLMTALHKCQSIDPRVLTPFAESDIDTKLEQEATLITQSIDRIFASILTDISEEVRGLQVKRLAIKFDQLSFMDSYYSLNKSNTLPYFKKLFELMEKLQKDSLSILCPSTGAIGTDTAIAIKYLNCLQHLDSLVTLLIGDTFIRNRDGAIAIISAFNNKIAPPDGYASMGEGDWMNWLRTNRPPKFYADAEEKIKQYQAHLQHELTRLMTLQIYEVNQQKFMVVSKYYLANNVACAKLTQLQLGGSIFDSYNGFLKSIIPVSRDVKPIDGENIMQTLGEVMHNLQVQNKHLQELVVNDNDIIVKQYTALEAQLVEVTNKAILTNNYIIAAQTIARIATLEKIFNITKGSKLDELKASYRKSFEAFVKQTNEILQSTSPFLTEVQVQTLILYVGIVTDVTNLEEYQQCIRQKNSKHGYPELTNIHLSSIVVNLSKRFNGVKEKIQAICTQDYSLDNFTSLASLLQQLWHLLSIPSSNHAGLVKSYGEVVNAVVQYCANTSGQFSGQLQSETKVERTIYQKIIGYFNQLAGAGWVNVLQMGQPAENLVAAIQQRALFLAKIINEVDLNLGNEKNLADYDPLVREAAYLAGKFVNIIPPETITLIQTAQYNYDVKINGALDGIFTKIQEYKGNADAEIPLTFLMEVNRYIIECETLKIFSEKTGPIKQALSSYMAEYTYIQKTKIAGHMLNLQSTAEDNNFDLEILTTQLQQFAELKENIPYLYAICEQPIETWVELLNGLVLHYQQSLSNAVQAATAGQDSQHEKLLNRVFQLQVFDEYIKDEQYKQSDAPVLTFKKLHKRFEMAFNATYFLKLSGVMKAVFNGDFAAAQQLVRSDEVLAPGTDMRVVLIDQIGTYILASIGTIVRAIKQLENTPVPSPACMPDLMKSHARIKSAQQLVEAGLLSESMLEKRDTLLTNTQQALDVWMTAVIRQIEENLAKLDFKLANNQLLALNKTLKLMEAIKPSDAESRINQLIDRFVAKHNECKEQYQRPLTEWSNNTYTLAQVANAFDAAKDLSFGSGYSYADNWQSISKQINQAIDTHCSEIESKFSKNQMGVGKAVSALETIQALTKGMSQRSALRINIKERYVNTVNQIEKDVLEEKKEQARLDKLQELLAVSRKFVAAIGGLKLAAATGHIQHKAQELNEEIVGKLKKHEVPSEQLILFTDLYHRFANQFDFLNDNHKQYVGLLENIIQQACEDIKQGKSQYGSGSQQASALKKIHSALEQLVVIQRLSGATKTRTPQLIDQNLHQRIVLLLLELKDLLLANNEKFKAALQGRNLTDLNEALVLAKNFQDITMGIEQYINACDISPLPADFAELKQLNNDYNYGGLRNTLIAELKEVMTKLKALNAKTSAAEGEGLRKTFYTSLKRDITFIRTMPELKAHFNEEVFKTKALDKDYGLANCLLAVRNFLAETFRLANTTLLTVPIPSVTNDWVDFNRYYQELTLFVELCQGDGSLWNLQLPLKSLFDTDNEEAILASVVAQQLVDIFDEYLQGVIKHYKDTFFKDPIPENANTALIALLAGLQKMAEDMPVLADNIKAVIKQFLGDIQAKRQGNYMTFLAEQLRIEDNGFGPRMVASQSIFAGMMIAERNQRTMSQDINYVLKHLQVQDRNTGEIRALTAEESEALLEQYNQFEKLYSEQIKKHIAESGGFTRNRKVQLERLRTELLDVIKKMTISRDGNGHINWNENITQQIPTLYAYLFVIWTLTESAAFFDETNTDADKARLKKPHPAQMVAIFLMLNTLDAANTGLQSHINEVLTGEGKSVVLAATAALLALLGFAADVGCYSEYLSERDAASFKWLFNFLNVSEYIQYGTFNRLSEDMLNQQGDLRDIMSNTLFDTSHDIQAKKFNGRQTIALIDEVDSLVTAFFGHMYQPYFLLKGNEVDALLDAVWKQHINGNMKHFGVLLRLHEYKKCLVKYKGCDYLIKQAAKEMFADLSQYKPEQGHEFHVSSDGDIYYRHYDGATQDKSIGYRTYWACMDKSNHISDACKNKHRGLKITCGAFSYADLMCDSERYRSMLGVTGTYRELTGVEKSVVKEVFGIESASFIPSAYGKNRLHFNTGKEVHVVADDEYDVKLCKEIQQGQVGWKSERDNRPNLVFCDSKDEVNTFHKSDAFKPHKSNASVMTSETITTAKERDARISRATRVGQITLATKEHGRGSDYILSNPQVIADGGMNVIDGFVPETEAEERQHKGRGGRQGQDGSYSMVIKESELEQKFALSSEAIEDARKNGQLYEVISKARNEKFSKKYKELVDDSKEMYEQIHKPSMTLLEQAHKADVSREELIKAHKKTLSSCGVEVKELREAKVLILFDSTGSMGNLIQALKDTLAKVVENLEAVLTAEGAKFQLQLAHYEDYCSGPTNALRYTNDWSCDSKQLKKFISTVRADGGGGNESECVELGLYHANQLVKSGLNHVILIGDEPPSPKEEMCKLRKKHRGYATTGAFVKAEHYKVEAESLAKAKVPVSTFFTRTSMFNSLYDNDKKIHITEKKFKNIADKTGGEAGELKLSNSATAAKQVTDLFARKIIGTVVEDDTEYADELYKKFQQRMQQFSK